MPVSPYSPSGHVSIQSVPRVNHPLAPHVGFDRQLISAPFVFLYMLTVVHVTQFVADPPLHVKQEVSQFVHAWVSVSPYSPSGHVSIQSVPRVNHPMAPHGVFDMQLISAPFVFLYMPTIMHVTQFIADPPLHVKQEASQSVHVWVPESPY